MAKLSTEELLEQFKGLTLIELSEFVKAFEETFEVTAAAPVAVAGPAAAGGGAAAEEVEEKDSFDVVLEAAVRRSPGHQGRPRAHLARPRRGQGRRRRCSQGRARRREQGAADKAKAALEEAGATVTLK